MRSPRAAAVPLVALALLGRSSSAHATEGQLTLGATLAYGALFASEDVLVEGQAEPVTIGRVEHGLGVLATARYGLTDAFDLALSLSGTQHPALDQTTLSAAAGVHYVVDIARFVPHVGVEAGVLDVVTRACETDPLPEGELPEPRFACGHDLRPSVAVPFGLEFAVTPAIRLGVTGRQAFALAPEWPTISMLTLGASFAYTFGAEDPPPQRDGL